MRSSKDIARRLRLRGYPGRDTFRRHYLALTIAAAGAAIGGWILLHSALGPRQFLPRPVSSNHAIFGDRCEGCHDAFRAVANSACLGCHTARVHAANEVATPMCATCHMEHRATDKFLSVSAQACVSCHGDLRTKESDAVVEKSIDSFHEHPEFAALREGKRDHDPAKLRYNHQVHFASSQIPESERPLGCPSCHRLQENGRWMAPIRFEQHCRRCHQQVIDGPTGSIEALHSAPGLVREDLRRQLLDAAAQVGTVTSEELRRQLDKLATPSPELLFPQQLPGRIARAGFSKERLSVAALERDLYKEFAGSQRGEGAALAAYDPPAPSLYEQNKGCFLCHFQEGKREAEDLPVIAATNVPARWLRRSEFSHRRHELMPCEECHPRIRDSRTTSDTNLPGKAVCERCHVDGARQSAGTACMSCHLYHDTSKAKPGADCAPPTPGSETFASQGDCAETGRCPQDPSGSLQRPAPLPRQEWWKDPHD